MEFFELESFKLDLISFAAICFMPLNGSFVKPRARMFTFVRFRNSPSANGNESHEWKIHVESAEKKFCHGGRRLPKVLDP